MTARPHLDVSRRHFLWQAGGGLGGMALSYMLGRQGLLGGAGPNMDLSGGLHHPPKAKRVIQLFMAGAASHVDLFDHKPQRERGRVYPSFSRPDLALLFIRHVNRVSIHRKRCFMYRFR